ncbi:hypothetical protein V6Z72_14420 [Cereibacter sphaeroides]|uniref:hypothetical protein n=1 Tax=Cereibacter sphaeroides TaxID=1063 RepID=UPI003990AE72
MARKANGSKSIAEALRVAQRSIARKNRARERYEAEIAARVPGEGYEPSIVSFIDVLGFRNLLATRHAHDIRDVLMKLREFTAPFEERLPRPVKDARTLSRAYAESVSDAIVRVRVYDTMYHDGAFFREMIDLLHAQIECIGHGVFIRAGVAIGSAHVGVRGEGPIFGPAMVRAYEIETNEAVYPRIVVDTAAYQSFLDDARLRMQQHCLQEEIHYVDRLLRVDKDGKHFIDYLVASETEFDSPASYFLFLERHAILVRTNLATTTTRVREKFEWLAAYHNSVVENILAQFAEGRRSVAAFIAEFGTDPVTFLQAAAVRP